MLTCLVGLAAPAAHAQGFEAVGSRALGMGGAFVAVADDATATYWNPAGLATGAIFSAVFGWQTDTTGEKNAPSTPDLYQQPYQGGASQIFAVGTPPLGMTYYSVRATRLHGTAYVSPAIVPLGTASSLTTHHTGVTLVQSVGEHLHLGTTLKYVRGTAIVTDRLPGSDDADELKRVKGVPGTASGKFDLDLGAMAVFGRARAGLVIRNAAEPEFDAIVGGRTFKLPLERQVRAGVSYQATDATIVSVDVDLTKTDTEVGERRHVAAGAERWFLNKRLGVRGGVRVNTIDDADPVASGGVSVGLTPSVSIDAFVLGGAKRADRAWGVAGRLGF